MDSQGEDTEVLCSSLAEVRLGTSNVAKPGRSLAVRRAVQATLVLEKEEKKKENNTQNTNKTPKIKPYKSPGWCSKKMGQGLAFPVIKNCRSVL